MTEAFYIVWSPSGPYPPKVEHSDLVEAEQAALAMARRHPGQTFIVMQSRTGFMQPAMCRADYSVSPDQELPF